MPLPKKALAFTALMALAALAAVGFALHTMRPFHNYQFGILFVLALATARLRVKLPGLTGTMIVNLPFFLIAAAQLSMLEALLVALPSCAVQCIPKGGGKPKPLQLIFNLSTTGVAIAVASLIGTPVAVLGAAGFFLVQTLPLACIIRLTEGGDIRKIWCGIAHYSFPFYVLSAGIASIPGSSTANLVWLVPLLGLPVLYAVYRSYQSYFRVSSVAVGSLGKMQ